MKDGGWGDCSGCPPLDCGRTSWFRRLAWWDQHSHRTEHSVLLDPVIANSGSTCCHVQHNMSVLSYTHSCSWNKVMLLMCINHSENSLCIWCPLVLQIIDRGSLFFYHWGDFRLEWSWKTSWWSKVKKEKQQSLSFCSAHMCLVISAWKVLTVHSNEHSTYAW